MFVSFILRDQLAWDLHLGLAPEQVGAMRLGDNKVRCWAGPASSAHRKNDPQSPSGYGRKL
ncbi:type VI secretion protein [Escherichia coli]|uniref:Type VI secretion protein n=1 Tax=Escherichia coli TaxID=562 RepID=A0A376U400_ECOLX|nr:type VI secretion protein [Escherichia coli]